MIADAELARRLELLQASVHAEVIASMQRMRPQVGATALQLSDGNAAFAGVGSPLTQAIGLTSLTASQLDEVEELYFSRGADSIIHLTPWSDRAFAELLGARGYAAHEFENVFVRAIGENAPQRAGIDVREIGKDEVPERARIGAEAFANEHVAPDVLADIMEPFAYAEHARCYIAYIDGEAAGSASSFAFDGIIGLFGAGTRERFRNRGVQAALLERRLADGAANGCTLAMVTTLPGSGSHRNVARSGFELVYTKVAMRRAKISAS